VAQNGLFRVALAALRNQVPGCLMIDWTSISLSTSVALKLLDRQQVSLAKTDLCQYGSKARRCKLLVGWFFPAQELGRVCRGHKDICSASHEKHARKCWDPREPLDFVYCLGYLIHHTILSHYGKAFVEGYARLLR